MSEGNTLQWQYPWGWTGSEPLLVSHVGILLQETGIGPVLEVGCSHHVPGNDVRVWVYTHRDGGQETWSDFVDVCPVGAGAFNLYGRDLDRVQEVLAALQQLEKPEAERRLVPA